MEISIETNFEDQVEMNYYFQTSKEYLKKIYLNYITITLLLLLLAILSLKNKNDHSPVFLFGILFFYYLIFLLTIKNRTRKNLIKYLSKNRASSLNYTTKYNFSENSLHSKNEIMETIVPYSSFHYFTFRKESIYLTLNNGISYIFKWRNIEEKNELIETFEQISDKHQVLIYRNEN